MAKKSKNLEGVTVYILYKYSDKCGKKVVNHTTHCLVYFFLRVVRMYIC